MQANWGNDKTRWNIFLLQTQDKLYLTPVGSLISFKQPLSVQLHLEMLQIFFRADLSLIKVILCKYTTENFIKKL